MNKFIEKEVISVIIPCYNQGKFLREAVGCIINQSYQNWECIIVNDGSTDDTNEIALNLCSQDKRVKYLKKENGGLSSARNAGIMAAKGQFIQFLDSDDIIGPLKLERQVNLLEHKQYDIALSNCYMFEKSTKYPFEKLTIELSKSFNKDIVLGWDDTFTIPIHCALFRASFFGQDKILFDTELKAKEDWYMWFIISKKTNKVWLDLANDVYYRWHPQSMSKNLQMMLQNQLIAIFKIESEITDPDLKEQFRLSIARKIGKPFEERAYKLSRYIATVYGLINRNVNSILFRLGLK